ncbi:hypothetical protein CJ030_MR2G004481 [Morella rubra]|uniref:DUF7026 domain-containing protein n=1 Tax=Morella rubra TaxID=262757 RepID=A0A6A1V298_9ROSI|nr:hypothetical protein CJ030_MR7G013522 [Morella rubra]KAB1224021.1 hypothetical protein CJ030_MR2G004481 [Morella rubra]
MASGISFLSSVSTPRPQKCHPRSFLSTTLWNNKPRAQIPCTNKIRDAELSSDLASEVAKRSTHLVRREEAMEKSKELLFTELCQYLALKREEVKTKWRKMDQEEKWALVKGFVSEWSLNFHPLSARSVKEMVEEYLKEESPSASPPVLLPGLKRIIGISEHK